MIRPGAYSFYVRTYKCCRCGKCCTRGKNVVDAVNVRTCGKNVVDAVNVVYIYTYTCGKNVVYAVYTYMLFDSPTTFVS